MKWDTLIKESAWRLRSSPPTDDVNWMSTAAPTSMTSSLSGAISGEDSSRKLHRDFYCLLKGALLLYAAADAACSYYPSLDNTIASFEMIINMFYTVYYELWVLLPFNLSNHLVPSVFIMQKWDAHATSWFCWLVLCIITSKISEFSLHINVEQRCHLGCV